MAPPDDAGSRSDYEVLIWHDHIHKEHESATLHWWRLSFAPGYDRAEIFSRLSEFYKAANITAHIAYELLGDYDLLLRLWVPRQYLPEEIEILLRDHLKHVNLWNLNYMHGRTDLHWAGFGGSSAPVPTSPTVDNGDPLSDIGDALIQAVNDFNDAQFLAFTNDRPEVGQPAGLEPLLTSGALVPVSLAIRGVRLFVTFDHPRRPLSPAERAEVVRKISDACLKVRSYWSGEEPGWPAHLSVYSGTGTMTDYLIMARAPYGAFHKFVGSLLAALRATQLAELHQMRPYTYVLADEMFSEFTEHRQTVAAADISLETLQGGESESLELKGTFAVNLRRAFVEGARPVDPNVVAAVIKAVSGLLNSPSGGTLVIGVLEVEREYTKLQAQGQRLLKWLAEEFDYIPERREDGTLTNAIIGVEHEYAAGSAYQGEETYYAALRDTLKDHIEPNPWPFLRMAPRKIGEKRVAVISVKPAETWCYAQVSKGSDLEFFVREAASTRAYRGLEADLYREVNPRRFPRMRGR